MQVLITGGTGFVGMNIVEALLDEGADVTIYGLHPLIKDAEQSFDNRKGEYRYIQGDVLNRELLEQTIKNFNISTIIHAAAMTPGVHTEIKNIKRIVEVNCLGTVEILEAARTNNIKKFIYVSSVVVYGENAYNGVVSYLDEMTNPLPDTLYGITKLTSEQLVLRYKYLLGMDITVVRLGHVFGPWEYETGIRDTLSPLYQTTKLAVLGKKAFLPIPGYKCWVYSRDIASSLVSLLKAKQKNYDIYHLGSSFIWSLEDWCSLLGEIYPNFSYEITEDTRKVNINLYRSKDHPQLSIKQLIEDSGYIPQFDLKKSFEDYTLWIKSNSKFWI